MFLLKAINMALLEAMEKELAIAHKTINNLKAERGRNKQQAGRIVYQGGYIDALTRAVWIVKQHKGKKC